MPTGALIGSAVIGAGSSYLGAKSQEKSAQAGIDAQLKAQEIARGDLAPYRQLGQDALSPLLQTALEGTKFGPDNPAYQQVVNSMAARGKHLSGNQLTALTDYYGQVYQPQRYSQLYNIASLGQNAAAGSGSAAMQAGANIGNLSTQMGNAQAAGYAGIANAANQGIGNYLFLQGMKG